MIITELGHCYITFDNGYTLSIFNGFGSYTENQFNYTEKISYKSTRVEIAVVQDHKFVTRKLIDGLNDDVAIIDINELVGLIKKVSEL